MQAEILLAHFPKFTYKRYQKLMEYFGSSEIIFEATSNELKEARMDDTFTSEFLEWRKSVSIDKIENNLNKEGIRALSISQSDYPKLLKQIYDPPLCLFVKGTLSTGKLPLAIVGTRKNSPYGKQVTEELVGELSKAGVSIVSGLALGIDGIAHEKALCVGAETWAILGTAIDDKHIYPRAHFGLSKRIVENGGAIVSEYPPFFETSGKFTFARRNRIIAGITRGTIVIEAPESSGSLITAQCALEANREVFAVPQNITAINSKGPHALLKMGAHPVTEINDILEVFGLHKNASIEKITQRVHTLAPEEATLLSLLSEEPTHIDKILRTSEKEKSETLRTLTLLEIKGMVKNLGDMHYILSL